MVRVAGLKGQQLQDVDLPSADGLTPTQQLQAIAADADRLITDQQRAWHAIYGELARAGIEVVGEGSMDTSAEAWLEKHFLTQGLPILTARKRRVDGTSVGGRLEPGGRRNQKRKHNNHHQKL